jgi:hypothetical protein
MIEMFGHDPLSPAAHLFIGIISACYFVFAARIVYRAGPNLYRTRTGRAMGAVVAVFILCLSSGYVGYAIGLDSISHTALHGLLAVAAVWLVIEDTGGKVGDMVAKE